MPTIFANIHPIWRVPYTCIHTKLQKKFPALGIICRGNVEGEDTPLPAWLCNACLTEQESSEGVGSAKRGLNVALMDSQHDT